MSTLFVFKSASGFSFNQFYNNVKASDWPDCKSFDDFDDLPDHIKKECVTTHGLDIHKKNHNYSNIFKKIADQGNDIKQHVSNNINGAMIARIGKDLYFGTETMCQDISVLKTIVDKEFKNTRNHVINTGGHSDGTYCPVCPGLIVSLKDVPMYQDTYPNWEVVYLPDQSWSAVKPFLDLKTKNQGRWWIPGFEYDNDVVNTVESWLKDWTGYVEETVFDVNMLIIDPKNVVVFNYNKKVFDALERFGITPHVVPFRHRYFWDGGIHCVTSDLHREGVVQDFFPERNHV